MLADDDALERARDFVRIWHLPQRVTGNLAGEIRYAETRGYKRGIEESARSEPAQREGER